MSNNDEKIREVLSQIEAKKKSMGTKPRSVLKSNGIASTRSGTTNINTLTSLEACVKLATELMAEKTAKNEACNFLNVFIDVNTSIDDQLDDIKYRVSVIKWEAENKKLQAMEEKLKELRSADAKTADAIADVLKGL